MFGIDDAAIGAILGGVGQAAGGLGGLFGGNRSGSRDQWEMFNQNVQNQDRYWMQNANLQREFAKNSIQWRVADAKAAGIHPIFAMGGGGAAASPTAYVPGDIQPAGGGPDIGAALANMGQGVGRAFAANSTKEQRVNNMLEILQIQQASANIELTKAQTAAVVARMGPSQLGPGLPGGNNMIPGQGDVKVEPHEVTARIPGTGQTPGVQPYVEWQRHGDVLLAQPPKVSKAEDEFGAPLMTSWLARNWLAPNAYAWAGESGKLSSAPRPEIWKREFPGAVGIRFDYGKQGWVPIYPFGRR